MYTYDNITRDGLHIHLSMSNHNTCYIFVNDIYNDCLTMRYFCNMESALIFIKSIWLVVVEGIDPSSRAYEARAHPSTPHNLMLGYSMEFESMLTESQSVVLTADTNYTIEKHTRLPLQPCSCQFRMKLEWTQWLPLVVCICQFRLKVCLSIATIYEHIPGDALPPRTAVLWLRMCSYMIP